VERFFVAKQNTVVLLARRALDDEDTSENIVRLVRLKRPLARLLDRTAPRGKRAEDFVDALLAVDANIEDARDWDVHAVRQGALTVRAEGLEAEDEDDGSA